MFISCQLFSSKWSVARALMIQQPLSLLLLHKKGGMSGVWLKGEKGEGFARKIGVVPCPVIVPSFLPRSVQDSGLYFYLTRFSLKHYRGEPSLSKSALVQHQGAPTKVGRINAPMLAVLFVQYINHISTSFTPDDWVEMWQMLRWQRLMMIWPTMWVHLGGHYNLEYRIDWWGVSRKP